MNIEKMREDFLVWHQAQVARLLEHGEPTAAGVWRSMESMYWEAWRASRESLVIELPDRLDYTGCSTVIEECKKAIEAAGLKVKS